MGEIKTPDRQVRLFLELASIDSVSFHERKMADRLKRELISLGLSVEEDDAWKTLRERFPEEYTDQDERTFTGNLYAFWKGTPDRQEEAPLLFACHMDTVQPGLNKHPILHEDGRITSDGTTVLGADDLAGVTSVLEAIRRIRESGKGHPDIELVFPVAEERHGRGSAVLDYGKIRSGEAYVLDLSGKLGKAAIAAPTIILFTVSVQGKAAHAGFNPERGVNAIAIAAAAVSRIPQGWYDGETTLNFGMISGGKQTNIVSEECRIVGEVRSLNDEKAMEVWKQIRAVFEEEAGRRGGSCEFTEDKAVTAFRTGEDEPVSLRYKKACSLAGLEPEFDVTLGASDLNNFSLYGIRGIVAACGMHNVHTTEEYTLAEDLEKCARLTETLMTL